jgi:hypothetical protein
LFIKGILSVAEWLAQRRKYNPFVRIEVVRSCFFASLDVVFDDLCYVRSKKCRKCLVNPSGTSIFAPVQKKFAMKRLHRFYYFFYFYFAGMSKVGVACA